MEFDFQMAFWGMVGATIGLVEEMLRHRSPRVARVVAPTFMAFLLASHFVPRIIALASH